MALHVPFKPPLILIISWVALLIAFLSCVLWRRLEQQHMFAVVPGENSEVSSITLKSKILKNMAKWSFFVSMLLFLLFFVISI